MIRVSAQQEHLAVSSRPLNTVQPQATVQTLLSDRGASGTKNQVSAYGQDIGKGAWEARYPEPKGVTQSEPRPPGLPFSQTEAHTGLSSCPALQASEREDRLPASAGTPQLARGTKQSPCRDQCDGILGGLRGGCGPKA